MKPARDSRDKSVVVLLALAAMRMRADGMGLTQALALLRRVWTAGKK